MDIPHSRGRGVRIATRPWSDIAECCARSAKDQGWVEEMVALIRQIRAKGYADRLFGFTSMHELIIGLLRGLEHEIETWPIPYDKGAYKLRYFTSPTQQPEIEHRYLKEVGLTKFDDLRGYLNWCPMDVRLSPMFISSS